VLIRKHLVEVNYKCAYSYTYVHILSPEVFSIKYIHTSAHMHLKCISLLSYIHQSICEYIFDVGGISSQKEFLRTEYGTVDIFENNDTTILGITANASSAPLEFSGNLYEVNMILRALKYQSNPYRNGYDYINLSVYEDSVGLESNLSAVEVRGSQISNTTLRVFLVPVNNPPMITLANISLGLLHNDNVTLRNNTENYTKLGNYTSVGVIRLKEDTTYPIGSSFSISDPDFSFDIERLPQDPVFVSLEVMYGIIHLTGTSGLIFYPNISVGISGGGSGEGGSSFRISQDQNAYFSGAYNDVVNAVESAIYIPNKDFYGVDILTIYINDLGKSSIYFMK
jgi:hypothetical protein